MTSDINIIDSTVTAIQGNPVSETNPSEGDMLVWDGYAWTPTASGLRTQTFTSNGSWVCPPGITSVTLQGFGGGGGGHSGVGANGGGGGGGAVMSTYIATVVPGTTYNVTIGAGGTADNGGNRTEFGNIGFVGGGTGDNPLGGNNQSNSAGLRSNGLQFAGYGGNGGTPGNSGEEGRYPAFQINFNNITVGTGGSSATGAGGGGGGGMGPGLISGPSSGGNGGNAGAGGTSGGNGGNGTANSGSGGGGGGGSASGTPGTGGSGGSGLLTITW